MEACLETDCIPRSNEKVVVCDANHCKGFAQIRMTQSQIMDTRTIHWALICCVRCITNKTMARIQQDFVLLTVIYQNDRTRIP